jgi:plasmid maintenance system antidote protein VapI
MSAEFWLNLQIRWDIYKTQQLEKEDLKKIQNYSTLKKTA